MNIITTISKYSAMLLFLCLTPPDDPLVLDTNLSEIHITKRLSSMSVDHFEKTYGRELARQPVSIYSHSEQYPRIAWKELSAYHDPISPKPGILNIFGEESHFQDKNTNRLFTKKVIWKWDVPKEYVNSYLAISSHSEINYKIRFKAVLLLPAGRESKLPPLLCYFDSLKGLVWKLPISINSLLEKFGKQGNSLQNYHFPGSFLINQNGTRIFLSIASTEGLAWDSILSSYDNTGKLLRICNIEKANIIGGQDLAIGDSYFVDCHYSITGDNPTFSTLLFDKNLNLIARFADKDGKSVRLEIDSTGKLGYRKINDGKEVEVYDLTADFSRSEPVDVQLKSKPMR